MSPISFFGDKHTLIHRVITGTIVMIIGVNVAHVAEMFDMIFIRLSLDGLGYLIHGIGAVPFVELIKNITD